MFTISCFHVPRFPLYLQLHLLSNIHDSIIWHGYRSCDLLYRFNLLQDHYAVFMSQCCWITSSHVSVWFFLFLFFHPSAAFLSIFCHNHIFFIFSPSTWLSSIFQANTLSVIRVKHKQSKYSFIHGASSYLSLQISFFCTHYGWALPMTYTTWYLP